MNSREALATVEEEYKIQLEIWNALVDEKSSEVQKTFKKGLIRGMEIIIEALKGVEE